MGEHRKNALVGLHVGVSQSAASAMEQKRLVMVMKIGLVSIAKIN
jgi:hypothetical protein